MQTTLFLIYILYGQVRAKLHVSNITNLARIVGIPLGRPVAIHLDDIDVELPSPNSNQLIAPNSEDTHDSRFNRTAIFVLVINYRILCGKIMRTLHSHKNPEQGNTIINNLRDALECDLANWKYETQNTNFSSDPLSSSNSRGRSSFLSPEWYMLLYHNAKLMLFRPSPMISNARDSTMIQKLFESSRQAVLLYASLHHSRNINYSWITLHSVFMAGLTYLYALSRNLRERRKPSSDGAVLSSDPTAIEIVNDTRACSNVLVAVSERWNSFRY